MTKEKKVLHCAAQSRIISYIGGLDEKSEKCNIVSGMFLIFEWL